MKAHIFISRGAPLVSAILFIIGASTMGVAQDIKVKREPAPITRADSGPEMFQVVLRLVPRYERQGRRSRGDRAEDGSARSDHASRRSIRGRFRCPTSSSG